MTTFSIKTSGANELAAYLRSVVDRLPEAVVSLNDGVAGALAAGARADIDANITHPDRSTGALARSIVPASSVSSRLVARSVVTSIGASRVYAGVQQYGATIVPVNKQWLRWVDGGGVHFAKKVTIPAKKYMEAGVAAAELALPALADRFFMEVFA